ncbi:MAG TPA: helix-turn-helix domain-containing protein [Pirellulales bacterium]|jgi:excisionase family DNA binding protein|nr:helix-turn-helix domain-containing protein [Pirellulales bacterium]
MYTIKQVAEMLQVGSPTVVRFVDSGELAAVDVSLRRGKKRRLRVPAEALEKFLERRRVNVEPLRSHGRRQQPSQRRDVIDFFKFKEPEENGRRRIKISQVAEYLGTTDDHVRQLIAYGHLAAVNVGGTSRENRYRIAERDLYAFLERSRQEPKNRRAARLRGPDFLGKLPEGKQITDLSIGTQTRFSSTFGMQ